MNYLNLFDSSKLSSASQSTLMLGTIGAVLGGTVSAIENTCQVVRGNKGAADAFASVARETVGSGMATATAAATMAALGLGGLIGLAGFAAVATISKGLMDNILYGKEKPSVSKG